MNTKDNNDKNLKGFIWETVVKTVNEHIDSQTKKDILEEGIIDWLKQKFNNLTLSSGLKKFASTPTETYVNAFNRSLEDLETKFSVFGYQGLDIENELKKVVTINSSINKVMETNLRRHYSIGKSIKKQKEINQSELTSTSSIDNRHPELPGQNLSKNPDPLGKTQRMPRPTEPQGYTWGPETRKIPI